LSQKLFVLKLFLFSFSTIHQVVAQIPKVIAENQLEQQHHLALHAAAVVDVADAHVTVTAKKNRKNLKKISAKMKL
jgi:hypothetical protein